MIEKKKIIKKHVYERIDYRFGLGVCNYCKYHINTKCEKLGMELDCFNFCGLSIFMIIARKTKTAFDPTKFKHAYRVSQE